MSYDPVTESEIMEWHRSRGGGGIRAGGHAVRILRECVELCVASGARPEEIHEAFSAEMAKATDRGEFEKSHTFRDALEEFVDVRILMTVYRGYFVAWGDLENEMRRKLHVCSGRAWKADASGVLWRPGTEPASP
jgi:hypothetical protein